MATLDDVGNAAGKPQIAALGAMSVGDILNKTVPVLIGIAGLFLLFYLVMGGFGVMTSKGDPKALEAAKSKITSAVIGFVIIAIGYLLVQLIGLIFGVGNFGGII